MKKKKILKKVLLSLVGAFVLFLLIEMIFDWDGFALSVKEGYNDVDRVGIEAVE